MIDQTRLDALLADLEALYPGARASLSPRSSPTPADERRFRLLVSRRRPRLLVPTDNPQAARAATRRDSANDSRPDLLGRWAVAAVAASRLSEFLFPQVVTVGPVDEHSLEHELATRFGSDVRLSLHSGATRANAKPVVGVHRTTGAELGFCKVGITPLAARLVAHEASALRLLSAANLSALVVPPVLHAGRWNNHEVLVLGALRGHRGPGRALPVEAMRAVVEAPGTNVHPLRDGPWPARLDSQLRGASPRVATRIRQSLDALVKRHGAQRLVHGGSHGDWGPWNMSWSGDRPLVWDWERFTCGTPAGVDAAHFAGHSRLRQIGDKQLAASAVRDAEAAVRTVLAPWWTGTDADAAARTVVVAYLLDLATRFAVDAGDVGTDLVGRIADWYLDVADRQLDLMSTVDIAYGSGAAA